MQTRSCISEADLLRDRAFSFPFIVKTCFMVSIIITINITCQYGIQRALWASPPLHPGVLRCSPINLRLVRPACVWNEYALTNTHISEWKLASHIRYFHLCIRRWDLLCPYACARSELKHSIYRCQIFRYARVHIHVFVGEVREKKEQKARLRVALAPPRSPLTHVGVSFTRLRRINGAETYRGLFLDKTRLSPPSLQSIFA